VRVSFAVHGDLRQSVPGEYVDVRLTIEGASTTWMAPSVVVISSGLLPRSGDDSSSATTSTNARTRLPTASWIAPLRDVAMPEPPEYGANGRSLSPISTCTWSMPSPSNSAVTCVAIV
jgi:hypothetical protein